MEKVTILILAFLFAFGINANAEGSVTETETTTSKNDTAIFRGRLENDEYQVYIVMDFYNKNVVCPRQEIFGENPGYFGSKRDNRKWIIEDAAPKGNSARLVIINDYGSEDLDARLTRNHDGSYTLERLEGSTMKIAVNGKWVKIPKKLDFKKVR